MSNCKGKPGAAAGEISADGMYTLAEIRARLGLGTYALREARRHGLPVRKIGRRSYVLGKDILAFAAGGKTEQGEGNGGKGTTSQTTHWERLEKGASNNWVAVAFRAICTAVKYLVALGSGLATVFSLIRRFIVWLWAWL